MQLRQRDHSQVTLKTKGFKTNQLLLLNPLQSLVFQLAVPLSLQNPDVCEKGKTYRFTEGSVACEKDNDCPGQENCCPTDNEDAIGQCEGPKYHGNLTDGTDGYLMPLDLKL